MNRIEPWLSLVAAAALTALFLVIWQSQLIAPSRPAGTGFEQERAFATLSALLKEERPHIAGSPENKVVRDRIVEALTSYGYTPEIQTAFQCAPPDRYPGCTQVENIIAVHKGTGGGKAVLATAHYDSVAAGPGVADDGAGTAIVMELARTLVGRQTKNDVIILITDGEETGLRGAIAFAKHHPLMKQVGIVVNVEARGASGPSMMFETGPNNAALIDFYAKAVKQPSANSLTYEIYKLLPNDTDFTVYKEAGLTGLNFAFSNSASLYHSERDNLANLDRNTLQHQGDNMFATAFALADTDLTTLKADADASYFDLHGRMLFVWPASLNLPLAIVALIAILALIVMHRSAFSLKGAGLAVAAVIAAPILLFAVGWLLSFPLGIWPGVHPLDHPEPWPGRVATIAAALFVAALIGTVAARADQRALLLVAWAVLAAIAIAIAAVVTGASFLVLWPALGFAIAAWIETLTRKTSLKIAGWIGFAFIAFMWLPYLMALELVLGFDLTQFKILTLFPVVLALAPVFAASMRWIVTAVPLIVAAIAAAVASQTPAYAENHPRGLNLTYLDDRSSTPRWAVGFLGATDNAYLKKAGFPDQDEEYLQFGMIKVKGRIKPAQNLNLAPPTFVVRSSEMDAAGKTATVHGTLCGGQGGLQLGLGVAPDSGIRAIKVGGQLVADEPRLNGKKEPTIVRILGVGAACAEISLDVAAGKSPTLTLIERSPIPDSKEFRALKAVQPKDAAPVHTGDSAVVVTTVKDIMTFNE